MTMRGLLLILVMLNLGAGAWWFWHTPPGAETEAPEPDSGIARLQLVTEAGSAPRARPSGPEAATTTPATPADPASADAAQPAAQTAVAETPTPPPAAARCVRFGPFADAAALAAAETTLRPLVRQLRRSESPAASGRGWRVLLPPAADRAAAQAAADKLKAAGFSDSFIVGSGAEANSIALGRFSTEDRARAHAENLRRAGFEARAEPLGDGSPQRWLDAVAEAGFDVVGARRRSGAALARDIACPAAG
jgi:SPOR domain